MSHLNLSSQARFDARVSPEPNTGCWLWTGAVNKDGYALFSANGRTKRAIKYALGNFAPLDGQWICSRCRVPACVNPAHFWIGDPLEAGALRREVDALSRHELYDVWCGIKDRCLNANSRWFHRYGGRGISICQRWRDSFAAFLEDMGPRPVGLSIDRINNDGNYEPGNCRWATQKQQVANSDRARGSRLPQAKLNEKQVFIIKRLLELGELRQRDIAALFDVEPSCISDINRGANWRHVS